MIKFHCLALLAASVASSPIEILNYQDAEAGHGQVMSGIPGEAVTGEFYWNAPEGEAIRLVYTADMGGYVATGEHLPVSPELTPEVMEARDAFMEKFDEEKARAVDITIEEEEILEKMIEDEIVEEEIVEAEVAEVIEEALGLRTVEPDQQEAREARELLRDERDADAEADAQVLPLYYAPSYPYYFVNNLAPTVKKIPEDLGEMADEAKVDDMEMMDELDSRKYYVPPYYAPSYYYPSVPSLVQYPAVKTTVTKRVGNWYPVSNLQYPVYPGLVPLGGVKQFVQPQSPETVTNERILPAQPQAGEDESAALLL